MARKRQKEMPPEEPPYLSPKELAERWQCARSSVDRIARKAGFTVLHLGDGRNGMVRYLRKDVVAYEEERKVRLS